MVNTLTQSGRTKTYTLDPAGSILTTADTADTAGPTLTDHYTDGADNLAWIGASDGTWTRYLTGPSGGLSLSVTVTVTVTTQLQLANLHGDIVATCAPTDTLLPNYTDTTEYGLPRDPAAPTACYGWLGASPAETSGAAFPPSAGRSARTRARRASTVGTGPTRRRRRLGRQTGHVVPPRGDQHGAHDRPHRRDPDRRGGAPPVRPGRRHERARCRSGHRSAQASAARI